MSEQLKPPMDNSKIYRAAAKTIDSAANIASGHGKYELANQLWAFSAELRKKARDGSV